MSHNILNPTTSRVVYSDDARVIAGGERIYDITPDGTTDRAVARGDLVLETTEDDQDAEQSGPDEDAPLAPGESDPEQAH
jgi:hypothetical protein